MLRTACAQLIWCALVCGTLLGGSAANARADAATDQLLRRIAVERFELASNSHGMLVVHGAAGLPRGQWQASLWMGYEHKPLVLESLSTGEEIAPLIRYRVAGGLGISYGITSRIAVAVAVPLVANQAQGDISEFAAISSGLNAWGVGDIALMPQATLLTQAQHGVDVGLIARLVLPSGRDDAYLTNGKAAVGGTVAIARSWQRFEAVANLGYQTRPPRLLVDLEVNDEVSAKVGARYALAKGARAVKLSAALAMSTRATQWMADRNANAVELLAGGEWSVRATSDVARWSLQAIGGMGLSKGYGVPAWRAVLGARLAFGGRASGARAHVAARDATIAPAPQAVDADGDGSPDGADACPDQAETFNGIDDHDGCPDTEDRDNDGVHDAHDLCLDETAAQRAPGVPHDKFGCPYPAP